ncbi:MAG: hypothetical protein PHZ09_13095, partial [Eubacteriales bacterium]|nr:hypothetical protein [Eubacteriales bacterium]
VSDFVNIVGSESGIHTVEQRCDKKGDEQNINILGPFVKLLSGCPDSLFSCRPDPRPEEFTC